MPVLAGALVQSRLSHIVAVTGNRLAAVSSRTLKASPVMVAVCAMTTLTGKNETSSVPRPMKLPLRRAENDDR